MTWLLHSPFGTEASVVVAHSLAREMQEVRFVGETLETIGEVYVKHVQEIEAE